MGYGDHRTVLQALRLHAPSNRKSAMDITLPIRINSLDEYFNPDAATEWGHLAAALRFTTKCYI